MKTLVWVLLAVFAVACDDGTSDDDPPPETLGNLVEVAQEAGDFETLLAAATAAGLVDTLSTGGPFTLFAPTDDAFAALPDGALDDLLADTDALTRVLQFHLVAGELSADDVTGRDSLDTVAGEPLAVDASSGAVKVGAATVVVANVAASNGVIHVIDTVLMPPPEEEEPDPEMDIVDTAIDAGDFGTLVAAVQAAGLEDTLRGEGPFTVFAPTDDAFDALPDGTVETLLMEENLDMLRDILLFHVVPGAIDAAAVTMAQTLETALGVEVGITLAGDGGVTIGGATIVATDIAASNGIIHVIDAVLMPPEEPALVDIVDTAIAAGSFGTLVAAVQAAGLEDTLRGEGPFTVFAPTDDAFGALPDGTVETLLMEENLAMLSDILLFHVVPGALDAEAVLAAEMLETALGVDVMVDAEAVTIGGANITATDIMASNGIIHVIDAVIMPPEDEMADIVDTAIGAGTFETLVAAVTAADLVDTLRGEGPFTVFAPDDDAFDALPAGTVEMLLMPENIGMLTDILLYHVVPGALDAATVTGSAQLETALGITVPVDGATIDGANIIATDIMASNGIIHVIDAVIMPPADIVDTAIAAGTFETLVAAVQAADLVETLRGEGPFTVFAPSDDAFAALPAGTVERLLLPENFEELQGILLLHVVPGALFAADVVESATLETAAGASIDVQVGDAVQVGGATVVTTDIRARNGVIHVIDSVILPGG